MERGGVRSKWAEKGSEVVKKAESAGELVKKGKASRRMGRFSIPSQAGTTSRNDEQERHTTSWLRDPSFYRSRGMGRSDDPK